MAPPSYSLPVVTANLIERLEGARRTWLGQPDEARAGFRRIADETLADVQAEHEELFGDDPAVKRLRREVLETFLPRYTRLALDHNELEEQGYRSWRRGDPVSRIAVTSAALLLAVAVSRLIHHPAAAVLYGLVLLVPFVPEIRAGWFRHKYRQELQVVVDDMDRIQEELDRYAVGAEQHERRARAAQPEDDDPSRPPPPKQRVG